MDFNVRNAILLDLEVNFLKVILSRTLLKPPYIIVMDWNLSVYIASSDNDWLTTVLRPARKSCTRKLQNLGLYSALRAFEQGWISIYCAIPAVKLLLTALFSPSYNTQGDNEDLFWPRPSWVPFSRLLRHARGCWGSILTRTLTGSDNRKIYVRLLMSISHHKMCKRQLRHETHNHSKDQCRNSHFKQPSSHYTVWPGNKLTILRL